MVRGQFNQIEGGNETKMMRQRTGGANRVTALSRIDGGLNSGILGWDAEGGGLKHSGAKRRRRKGEHRAVRPMVVVQEGVFGR